MVSDEQVITLYGGTIRTIVRRLAISPAIEFDDLYQVGCIAAVTAVRAFDPSRGKKRDNWVHMMVTFAVVSAIRDEWHHANHVDIDALWDFDGGVTGTDDAAQGSNILDLIGKLEPRKRALMVAIYVEGWKMAEVARKWGVSRERVRQIHERALEQLRQYCEVR